MQWHASKKLYTHSLQCRAPTWTKGPCTGVLSTAYEATLDCPNCSPPKFGKLSSNSDFE